MNPASWARALLLVMLAPSCGGSSPEPRAPALDLPGQSTCKVKGSQLHPLIVEWPSVARAELEARMKSGPVVVRYSGCEMDVLPQCRAKNGAYRYVGVTRKVDRISIRDEDTLWANMPIGAAGLEADLRRSGQLDVSMTIVGQYESTVTELTADDLEGSCDGATHLLASMSVGAFELTTAARNEAGVGVRAAGAGVGARSAPERETISADGNAGACLDSRRGAESPPADCGALLRVDAVALGARGERPAVCPEGSHWDGEVCVREQVVTRVQCPPGSTLQASGCVAMGTGAGQCPDDMIFVPAGSFSLASGGSATLEQIGDLCVDRTEVTARAYLACVAEKKCKRSARKDGCWVIELEDRRTGGFVSVPSTVDNPATHDHPINCVTQEEASAYCRVFGKRLPTEAEWEWVARGGVSARRFTWGDASPGGQACWYRARKGSCSVSAHPGDQTIHGVLGMGGNVTEWTSSFERGFPVTRGASFFDGDPTALLVTSRPPLQRSVPRAQQGFRCVLDGSSRAE